MKKIEKEFDKCRCYVNEDYVEKFILQQLKKCKCKTVTEMLDGVSVDDYYFKEVARFISEDRKSFCVEFNCGLENIYPVRRKRKNEKHV